MNDVDHGLRIGALSRAISNLGEIAEFRANPGDHPVPPLAITMMGWQVPASVPNDVADDLMVVIDDFLRERLSEALSAAA